ncbi:MAG: NAD(+)/NADH kinase [Ignavibacteriales bacterium]|nr:NAD(+)/NADH kinase [Ignavibacteriales bacterium]
MKFGIAGNLKKEGLPAVVESLMKRFETNGVPYVIHEGLARRVQKSLNHLTIRKSAIVPENKLAASCDMLISLGGDGTILMMSRLLGERGTPILGINLGKLGFLAEVSLGELDEVISEILDKKYRVQDRMMLEATVQGVKQSFVALNDIVVDKYGSARVMDFETLVNDEYLATFTGDGIILSTPTGSTAYALANGGPIVTPANHLIVISPICPHTLTARPVIVPENSKIDIRINNADGKIHFTADGQVEKLLSAPVTISVKRSPHTAKLVKRLNTNYYQVLREKLHWGRDVRLQSRN